MKTATDQKQVIDQRVDELLKRFHKRARVKDTKVANCHGATAYVLGLTNRLSVISPDDMAVLIGRICEGEDKRFRAPYFIKLRRGDLMILDGPTYMGIPFVHTGVVTVPDGNNPTIFSKNERYSCNETKLKELIAAYPGCPVRAVRIERR